MPRQGRLVEFARVHSLEDVRRMAVRALPYAGFALQREDPATGLVTGRRSSNTGGVPITATITAVETAPTIGAASVFVEQAVALSAGPLVACLDSLTRAITAIADDRTPAPPIDDAMADRLERLRKLHERGALDAEEWARERARVLGD